MHRSTSLKILTFLKNPFTLRIALRRLVIIAIDGLLIAMSYICAFALRLRQHELLATYIDNNIALLPLAIVIGIPTLYLTGWYRGLTRYAGSFSLYGLLPRSALMVMILMSSATLLGINPPPRSFWLLYWILLTVSAIGVRIILRDVLLISLARNHKRSTKGAETATLIYGAGSSGLALCMSLRGDSRFRVIGFIDDDSTLHGRTLHNLPIWGPLTLSRIAPQRNITQVLLAIPSINRDRKRHLVDQLTHQGLEVLSIPSLRQLASGQKQVSDLKPVRIEDLLGREPTSSDPRLLERSIRGKVVLVTGAGGSIGSELCRQSIALGALHLVMLERNEFSLYSIDKELEIQHTLSYTLSNESKNEGTFNLGEVVTSSEAGSKTNKFSSVSASKSTDLYEQHREQKPRNSRKNWTACLGDACNQEQLTRICKSYGVQTIFHAAAYKHVPMVESNICVGVHNNIMATASVIKAALICSVDRVTLISTDKAVRPTNAMGASKRICEMLMQKAANHQDRGAHPIFSIVRFGNVLGSSGSVIPLFHSQIATGGPVTVTHPAITRYFMTIPEAVALVIQASGMATGGDLFLLDMGEPIRIADLARQMIELSGYRVRDNSHPSGDMEIVYTGLRPGEKLYEELLISAESLPTQHPLIRRAIEPCPLDGSFPDTVHSLLAALKSYDVEVSSKLMRRLVPEYSATA